MNELVKALVTAWNAAATLSEWTFYRVPAVPRKAELGQVASYYAGVRWSSAQIGGLGATDAFMARREGTVEVVLCWDIPDSPDDTSSDKGWTAAEAMLTLAQGWNPVRQITGGGETWRLGPVWDLEERSPIRVPWDETTDMYGIVVRIPAERLA